MNKQQLLESLSNAPFLSKKERAALQVHLGSTKKSAKEKFRETRRIARFRNRHILFDHMYEEQIPEDIPQYADALCPWKTRYNGFNALNLVDLWTQAITPIKHMPTWPGYEPPTAEKLREQAREWIKKVMRTRMGEEWK